MICFTLYVKVLNYQSVLFLNTIWIQLGWKLILETFNVKLIVSNYLKNKILIFFNPFLIFLVTTFLS